MDSFQHLKNTYTLYIRDVSEANDFFLRKNAVAFETSFYFLLACYDLLQYQEIPITNDRVKHN